MITSWLAKKQDGSEHHLWTKENDEYKRVCDNRCSLELCRQFIINERCETCQRSAEATIATMYNTIVF